MIRIANENDIARIAEIYEHIHDAEEAGVVFCNFNGIPDVRLICLEKKL